MKNIIDQLNEKAEKYNEDMKPLWDQKDRCIQAEKVVEDLYSKYGISEKRRTYLQNKEIEDAEKEKRQQAAILKDMNTEFYNDIDKNSVYHKLSHDLKEWVIEEVVSDNEFETTTKEVYEAFSKALQINDEYKKFVDLKTKEALDKVIPSNFKRSMEFDFRYEYKMGNEMAMIGPYEGSLVDSSSVTPTHYFSPKALYFSEKTLESIINYQEEKRATNPKKISRLKRFK